MLATLKINKEFKRAYFQGKFKAHPLLVTYCIKNKLPISRYGITTSKKIGNAVSRNRARRIIRQAFYEILSEKKIISTDIVFVARGDIAKSSTAIVKAVMKKQLDFLL